MRQFEVVIVDSISTLLHALCKIVSNNDYLARLVPNVAQIKLLSKKAKKERKRGRGLVEDGGTEERVHCFCGRIPCIT